MRINSISPRNLSFKRFLDDNARQVVKQALVPPPGKEYLGLYSDLYFKRVDECQYLDVYTDKDGAVKAKFDDEFIKGSEESEVLGRYVQLRTEQLKDFSDFENIGRVARTLESMDTVIAGIDPTEEFRSKPGESHPQSYAAMRAEEEAYHG